MPSLLLNLDKHSHFPYLLDIEMTVFYRDDFLKILYIKSELFDKLSKSNAQVFYSLRLKKKNVSIYRTKI